MPVQISRRLFSVEVYHRMLEAGILTADDKVELIKGELVERSPIGSKHAYIVDRLTMYLGQEYEKNGIIRVQSPITISNHSEPEPDLTVLQGPIERYSEHHPTEKDVMLLIEVSATTLEIDRQIKLPLYAEAGIPEVWIVNLETHEVEQYQEVSGKQYLSRKIFPLGSSLKLPFIESEIGVNKILGK